MPKKMSAKRFNELVDQLALTSQAQAAKTLGIGRRSFVRYANRQLPVPTIVARLLLMLVEHGPLKSKEW